MWDIEILSMRILAYVLGIVLVFVAAIIALAARAARTQRLQDGIVGSWEIVGDDDTFEFYADGTLYINKDDGTDDWTWYRLQDGGILTSKAGAGGATVNILYQVDILEGGDEAVLTEDGETRHLLRIKQPPGVP